MLLNSLAASGEQFGLQFGLERARLCSDSD